MADDIVTRLQNAVFRDFGDGTVLGGSLYEEAADEIERLRADLIMKNRHIDELATEIDCCKEWLASKAFAWEEDGVGDEAADEIERLRAGLQDAWSAADMLATQLERISSGNTDVLREYDQRREEACRG